MLIVQSLKLFFIKNRLLSLVFLLLLVICLTGTFFGVNYVLCRVHGYNMYLTEKKTFTLLFNNKETPDINKIIEEYPNDILAMYSEVEFVLDNDNIIDARVRNCLLNVN